jgi:hypothetical protein
MKSLRKRLLAKSILAAAIAASGIAAPAVSHAIVVSGGPSAGMACRPGYNPTFDGTRLTCSKPGAAIVLSLKCLNRTFPTFVMRAGGPGPKGDNDLCTRREGSPGAVVITTNGTLNGLTESTNGQNGDYEYATLDAAELITQTNIKDQAEASALGLTVDQVDTRTNPSVVVRNGGTGGLDRVDTAVVFSTFAVPAGGPIVVGNPGPGGLATPFVPVALPR